MRVTDDTGQAVVLAAPARRVVSLGPHLTEIAYAAGGGHALVGVIRFSDFPEAAKSLPVVGDAHVIDFERIVQLKPDLVLVWGSGLNERHKARLRSLGLAVYESEIRNAQAIPDTLRRLGTLLGRADSAEASAQRFESRWQALAERHRNKAPVRVFWQLWHEPLMTINREHLISEAMRACGGVNVFAELPLLTPSVELGSGDRRRSATGRGLGARRRCRTRLRAVAARGDQRERGQAATPGLDRRRPDRPHGTALRRRRRRAVRRDTTRSLNARPSSRHFCARSATGVESAVAGTRARPSMVAIAHIERAHRRTHVKPCLALLALIASSALISTPALAQSSTQKRSNAPAASAKAPAANIKAAGAAAAATTITAAGSVIILADGIVANAALAQIQAPADGFVYER